MVSKTNISIYKKIKLSFTIDDIIELLSELTDEQCADIVSELVDNRNVLYLVASIQHKKINKKFSHDNKVKSLDYNDPEIIKEYDEDRREQAAWKEIQETYQDLHNSLK